MTIRCHRWWPKPEESLGYKIDLQILKVCKIDDEILTWWIDVVKQVREMKRRGQPIPSEYWGEAHTAFKTKFMPKIRQILKAANESWLLDVPSAPTYQNIIPRIHEYTAIALISYPEYCPEEAIARAHYYHVRSTDEEVAIALKESMLGLPEEFYRPLEYLRKHSKGTKVTNPDLVKRISDSYEKYGALLQKTPKAAPGEHENAWRTEREVRAAILRGGIVRI